VKDSGDYSNDTYDQSEIQFVPSHNVMDHGTIP